MKKKTLIIAIILLIIIGGISCYFIFKDKDNNEPPMVGGNFRIYDIMEDKNGNGIADVGDKIVLTISREEKEGIRSYDEHFYVISNDGNKIIAFAEKSLNVGSEEFIECQNGVQNSGESSSNTRCKVLFSDSKQHGKRYNTYEGSIVEKYINEYIEYLNSSNSNLNATGRLILKEEIEELINEGNTLLEGDILNKASEKKYNWLCDAFYWTGTTDGYHNIWVVDRNEIHLLDHSLPKSIRPVIIIDAN